MKFPKKPVVSVVSLSLLVGNVNLLTNNINSKFIYAQNEFDITTFMQHIVQN